MSRSLSFSSPIQVSSLNNEAYLRIKDMILCGELSWGSRVEVGVLAGSFGISKFPVIKAIERLSLEKLVTVSPNKGTYVVSPTEQDVAEITEIRKILEPEALRLACIKNRTALIEDLSRLQNEILPLSYEKEANLQFRDFLNYDRAFHMAFFRHAGNERILSYYSTIRSQAELFRTKTYTLKNLDEAMHKHDQILDALLAKDCDSAISHLLEHLSEVHDDTIASF